MKTLWVALMVLPGIAMATTGKMPDPVCQDTVQWTRFRGEIKALNLKTNTVTLENKDGDVFSVVITKDVKIMKKKEKRERPISELQIDDPITLMYLPTVEKPPEETPAP